MKIPDYTGWQNNFSRERPDGGSPAESARRNRKSGWQSGRCARTAASGNDRGVRSAAHAARAVRVVASAEGDDAPALSAARGLRLCGARARRTTLYAGRAVAARWLQRAALGPDG